MWLLTRLVLCVLLLASLFSISLSAPTAEDTPPATKINTDIDNNNNDDFVEPQSFNATEYRMNRLSPPPKPTKHTCQLIDRGNARSFKVLVFVDACYFSLYRNWHQHYLDVCGEEKKQFLEIVCMDTEVTLSVSELGMNCSVKSFVMQSVQSYAKKQALVWIKRLESSFISPSLFLFHPPPVLFPRFRRYRMRVSSFGEESVAFSLMQPRVGMMDVVSNIGTSTCHNKYARKERNFV